MIDLLGHDLWNEKKEELEEHLYLSSTTILPIYLSIYLYISIYICKDSALHALFSIYTISFYICTGTFNKGHPLF